MRARSLGLGLALVGAAALWAFSRTRRGQVAQVAALDQLEEIEVTARRLPEVVTGAASSVVDTAGGWLEGVIVTAQRIAESVSDVAAALVKWSPPAAAARFASIFADAARRYALPANLLERVAYQESRFRDDIITGRTASPAGALGIMQIVPRWHPGVDPLDPAEAIPYAANYLRGLYQQFGTWRLALAAYNWGPGNISKYKDRPDLWPAETVAYARDITRDLGLV